MADNIVVPIGPRILIRKDKDKKTTKGGIALPDKAEIPVITGRVIAISDVVKNEEEFVNFNIDLYDKVIFNPNRLIPVDIEDFYQDNNGQMNFILDVRDVFAVVKQNKASHELANNDNKT